ncbi:reverse transcriptase domain-containing protein [Tsukamurella sp. 8F]|uniref:reverse transcriptase domain-containing protein n=1 Tax=unclassified Tsukamurella TaxID=2633480 RepID=UPI0023B96546|nr:MULTISPECIES: reverse transcriptase domain-containing protein [unclassified Tsukamurella]MDF0532630.1 reverse transcriptase domain-containing protein [Tsukamurella sp. 8J]MDF0589531.1 reverse transcriptase domain-containing protein [Tsukamurella sp. 8F]
MEHSITVEEAALRTGKSVATIRRQLGSGDLAGKRVGGRWIVDGDRLPKPAVGRHSTPQRADFDAAAALRFLMKTDRKDLWVPDVLNWEDFRTHTSASIAAALSKCATGVSDPFEVVEVPKGRLLSRAGALLSFEDRLAYHTLCATFASAVDDSLSDRVFSSRLNRKSGSFFKSTFKQYQEFVNSVDEKATPGRWVVSTDLVSYFETINHQILFEDLKDLGVAENVMKPLRDLLRGWRRSSKGGLPIGPDASRLLGNVYLSKVDKQMIEEGYEYFRYMDDVRIVVDSERKGREALRKFEVHCRSRGLIVTGTDKSRIEAADSEARSKEDKTFELADYALRNGFNESRKLLRNILNDAFTEKSLKKRHAKFALVRLGKLVDRSVLDKILQRLEELSEVSKDSAFYLRSFISEKRVQAAITDFLSKPEEPGLEKYQEAWLIAVMLEVLHEPPAEWITYARGIAWNANQPVFLRSLAFNLVALGHESTDLDKLVRLAESDYDTGLVRGALVALCRIKKLSTPTIKTVLARHPSLKETSDYLLTRNSLPSLVQDGLWNDLRPVALGL